MQLGEIKHLDALSVDFSDPERMTMLAGAHERPALYRTINGGATWDDVSTALPPGIGNASQPLILDSSTYLLGTNSGTNSGVFRTTDGGATWSQVYEGGVYGIPTQLDDGTLLWMKEQGTGLVRSTDQGVSWAETVGPGLLAQGWTLAPLGDGSVAAIGRTTIVVTPDAGISWEVLGPRFPDDPPFGLTYSAAQDAIYIWNFTCDQVVPSESIHRLDLSPDD